MKKKIFSLLLIFTMFFGFAFTSQAQAEFIDDNTFVISNADPNINEEDVKEFLLILVDYAETNDLLITVDEGAYHTELSNVNYDGFDIDFSADLSNLDYTLQLMIDEMENELRLKMVDYNSNAVFDFIIHTDTNDFQILGMATYDFSVVITLFEEETIEEEGLSIFGFFKNFYSNYIFPNNILDTQTLNLITAVTTLLFFIGVFRGIYSIFFRNKRK